MDDTGFEAFRISINKIQVIRANDTAISRSHLAHDLGFHRICEERWVQGQVSNELDQLIFVGVGGLGSWLLLLEE